LLGGLLLGQELGVLPPGELALFDALLLGCIDRRRGFLGINRCRRLWWPRRL
jgi:hypothetical protein